MPCMQALAIGCRKTSHLLYSNRSAMYMHLKSYDLALEDAKKAVELAPKGYHMVRDAVVLVFL